MWKTLESIKSVEIKKSHAASLSRDLKVALLPGRVSLIIIGEALILA